MKLKYSLLGIVVLLTGITCYGKPSIHLSGTMKNNKNEHIALIDGQTYRVNEKIKDCTITYIDENGIIVKDNDESKSYYIERGQTSARLLETPAPVEEPATNKIEIAETNTLSTTTSPTNFLQNIPENTPSEKTATLTARWILAGLLLLIGFILNFIGSIWFLVEAFKESVWWGLGCLFIGFVSLIFLIMHWNKAAKPVGLSLLGVLLFAGAIFLIPDSSEFIQQGIQKLS